MAMTFPLSAAEFFSGLPISEITFHNPSNLTVDETAGGEALMAELGARLWKGHITLGKMLASEAQTPDVLLDVLDGVGRTFWAYDTRRPAPFADPGGLILGTATPTIASLPNAREMTLSGLPSGYVLTRGDYLAFDYGTPTRRALHRVASAIVVASTAGVTPVFEVSTMIRSGATVGAAVSLVKASCKAFILPGQLERGTTRRTVTEGMAFGFSQTLR